MQMMWIKLKGYRRFKDEVNINLSGKLICLIGSNEAGKTSILKALESLNNNATIDKNNIYKTTSESPEETYIKARFLLSSEESDEAKLEADSKLEIIKTNIGGRKLSFDPEPPKRDIALRSQIKEKLIKLTKDTAFTEIINKAQPNNLRVFQQLLATVQSQDEDLNIQTLKQQTINCRKVLDGLEENIFNEDTQFLKESFEQLIEDESKDSPINFARSIIEKKILKFLLFKDEDRNLQYQYTVGEITNKPKPLVTLAQLAELDLDILVKAINDDDSARYEGILEKAKDKINNIFEGKWTQSLLEVKFTIKNKSLEILIRDGDYQYSELNRRSEGFRQFLALVAFAANNDDENIILLIDEIELHLHYDGQADLLQTLSKQNFAKKIIYTTHSIGSLPEDLGGIKIVERTHEGFTSNVENKFWIQGGGIATLLPNIGAEQLAFLPLRNAVIVEGAMDMLLLPIIFREAIEKDNIGFLIVHGLSEESFNHIIYLEKRNGSNALYLTDCDNEGKLLKKQLIEQNIDKKKIFSLPGNLDKQHIATLEDMFNKDCLALAFNALLRKYSKSELLISPDDISDDNKAESLKQLANTKKISDVKIALAYEILDLLVENPNLKLIDTKYLGSLKKLHEKMSEVF